jgi:hypothetical protein
MGNRALLHANFVRLNDQGVPLLCSRKEAAEWYAGRAALCAFKHTSLVSSEEPLEDAETDEPDSDPSDWWKGRGQ